jgi:aminopeptidase N
VDAFFEQWIYGAGAPKFQVSYTYDEAAKQVKLTVKQTHKVEGAVGLFRVPVEVEIATAQGAATHRIAVSKAEETFALPAAAQPLLVLFDKGGMTLRTLDFPKPPAEWVYQLRKASGVPDRLDAVRALAEIKGNDEVIAALGEAARSDTFWAVRIEALRVLGRLGGPVAQKQIFAALDQPEPWVRSVAVNQLGGFKEDASVAPRLDKYFREDKAYGVRAAAVGALARQKAPNAFDILREAAGMDSPDERLRSAALASMGVLGDERALPMLLEWSATGKPLNLRTPAIQSLSRLGVKNKEVTQRLISYLGEPYQFVRFSTVFALAERGDPEAIPALEAVAKNPEVTSGMSQFIQSQIARLKPPPAGAKPAAPSAAQAAGAAPTNQQILEAIEKLQKETAEIKERLKKLEERLGERK